MHPLVWSEIEGFDLLTALNHGLIPSHDLSVDPARSLDAYIRDYLKEEIMVLTVFEGHRLFPLASSGELFKPQDSEGKGHARKSKT